MAVVAEIEVSILSVGSAGQFVATWPSCQSSFVNAADLPEDGVESWAIHGESSKGRWIVAFLRRYGFRRTTISGQRSDSGRPIANENGRLRRMFLLLP